MAKKNIRTIQYIEKTLRDANEPLTTLEIHDGICKRWPRTSASMSRIGNLLARHRQFVRLDYVVPVEILQSGNSAGASAGYNVHVWELSEDDSTRRDDQDGKGKDD